MTEISDYIILLPSPYHVNIMYIYCHFCLDRRALPPCNQVSGALEGGIHPPRYDTPFTALQGGRGLAVGVASHLLHVEEHEGGD